jgi:hypothetical protein
MSTTLAGTPPSRRRTQVANDDGSIAGGWSGRRE